MMMNIFFAVICLLNIAGLGTALVAEFWFGFTPCILCLYERGLYGVMAIVSFLGLLFFGGKKFFCVIIILLLLLSLGLAGYHLGIELGWWKGMARCSIDFIPISAEDLKRHIQAAPLSPCNEVSWRMLGLSATVWNILLLLVQLIGSVWVLKTARDG